MNVSVIIIVVILIILVCAVFYCLFKDKLKTSGGITPQETLNKYGNFLNNNSKGILRILDEMYNNIDALEYSIKDTYDDYVNNRINIHQYYNYMLSHSKNNKEFIIMINDINNNYQTRKIYNSINNILASLDTIDYITIRNYIDDNTDSDIDKVDKIYNDFSTTYKYIKRNIRRISSKLTF